MKAIGTTKGGAIIFEMNQSECRLLKIWALGIGEFGGLLPEECLDEPSACPAGGRPAAGPLPARHPLASGRVASHEISRISRIGRIGRKSQRHEAPPKTGPREKKCAKCQSAFRDQTRTNSRRFCDECRLPPRKKRERPELSIAAPTGGRGRAPADRLEKIIEADRRVREKAELEKPDANEA